MITKNHAALSSALPKLMRAAQGKDYGPIEEMISVEDNVPVPTLADAKRNEMKPKTTMLVKILSVALAPGDCRVLSGRTRKFQGPPYFPYVPGADCCGIVLELPPDETTKGKPAAKLPFQVGDRVAARFVGKPNGALGEYALVSTLVASKVPDNVTSDGAAALASASPATVLVERLTAKDERVLILGAGGGVGSHLLQMIRDKGAKFVVGTSETPQRLLEAPLSCNEAVDYNKDNVFEMPKYQKEPFDCVIDLGSGGWLQLRKSLDQGHAPIIKSAKQGGRFLTITVDTPTFGGPSIWSVLKRFLFTPLWRAGLSRSWFGRSKLPAFSFCMSLPGSRDCMERTMQLAAQGKLQPVLHGKAALPFTTEGVRAGFHAVQSHHPKGKVVIHVAGDDPTAKK